MVYTIALCLGVGLFLLGVKNLMAPFLTITHGVNGVVAGILLSIGGITQNPWVLATISAAVVVFVYGFNRPPSLIPAMARRFVNQAIFDSQDSLFEFSISPYLQQDRLMLEEKTARLAIAMAEVDKLTNEASRNIGRRYCEAMQEHFLREATKRNLPLGDEGFSSISLRLQVYERSLSTIPGSPRNIGRPLLAFLLLSNGDHDLIKGVDFSGNLPDLKESHLAIDWALVVKRGLQAGIAFSAWQEKAFLLLDLDLEFLGNVIEPKGAQ